MPTADLHSAVWNQRRYGVPTDLLGFCGPATTGSMGGYLPVQRYASLSAPRLVGSIWEHMWSCTESIDQLMDRVVRGRTEDGDTVPFVNPSWILPLLDVSQGSSAGDVVVSRILPLRTPSRLPQQLTRREGHYQEALSWIKDVTGLADERIARLLGVSRQTLHGWRRGAEMSDSHRRRLLTVREILERAARQHTTPERLGAWMDTPRGADGRTPGELIEAGEWGRARLYAISDPSPRLTRPPTWVRRRVPEAFRAGAEQRQEPVAPEPELDHDLLDDDSAEDDAAK